jgi:hypothetical protein
MVLLGKKLKHLAYLLVPMATIPALGVDTPFDPAPWVQYLHQMQAALSEKYANFEWTVFERQADLSALFARAESRILDSGSDADARGALDRLPRNLGDGHVVVDWPAHRRSLTVTGNYAAFFSAGFGHGNVTSVLMTGVIDATDSAATTECAGRGAQRRRDPSKNLASVISGGALPASKNSMISGHKPWSIPVT